VSSRDRLQACFRSLIPRAGKTVRSMGRCDRGATAIEYGLIVALMVLVVIGAMQIVGTRSVAMYDYINSNVSVASR
jgi:pilus assembly protein Flp/PilA